MPTSERAAARNNEIDWDDNETANTTARASGANGSPKAEPRIPGPSDLCIQPMSLQPSIADTLLGNFNRAGGDHKIIERSPTCACIELSTGKGRGLKRHVASMTWDEALKESSIWIYPESDDADFPVPRFFQDGSVNPAALKEEWRTQRGRMQMLWEHAVFDGVRCMMPSAAFDIPPVVRPVVVKRIPESDHERKPADTENSRESGCTSPAPPKYRDPRKPPVAPPMPCQSLDNCQFYTESAEDAERRAEQIGSAVGEIVWLLLNGRRWSR